jgi:hypothetical protein
MCEELQAPVTQHVCMRWQSGYIVLSCTAAPMGMHLGKKMPATAQQEK